MCVYRIPTEKMFELKSYKKLPVKIAKNFPELFDGCITTKDNDLEFITVMFDNGVPVCCVYGEIMEFRIGNDGLIETRVHIGRFEVKPSERGKGYGRKMVGIIAARYCPFEITLYPLDEAVKFWRHIGFKKSWDGNMRMKF